MLSATFARRHCSAVRRGMLSALLLLLAADTAFAQAAAVSQQPATPGQPDISKEAVVFDQMHTRIRVEADGTGTRETTIRVRVLADAGVKAMAVLAFPYSSWNQQIEIAYVRVKKPDGSIVTTPDYNVQDLPADITREAPMYSDIHQKHVAVRGLAVGDTLEYQVTIRTLKPEVPGQFWLAYDFQKILICLDEQLDLDVPSAKSITIASAAAQPEISTVNGRKLYHWVSNNLTRPDLKAAPKSVKHQKPSVQVTTFTSWQQVGDWYVSLQKNALTVTPAIQARADALTRGLNSDDDKVRAIFNDVALHIHYIGLEFGVGRFQPHSADDVLANQYGDCKDKHTLLAAMLRAEGIEAWPVLISSLRDTDVAVPSPAQFNHVITYVPLASGSPWMDSTEELAPVGVLAAVLRDKQGLVVPQGKPAYLASTPDRLPTPRSVRVHAKGKLSSAGAFTGQLVETADGDMGTVFRTVFRRVPESEWKELVQGIARGQGYAGEVSNVQASAIEQIDQPIRFTFDYTREKYYQWDDADTRHWIGAPLPPMGGELAPGVKPDKPADDPDLGTTAETLYQSEVQLPDGWTASLPKNVHLREDWMEYTATYSFQSGVLNADRHLVVKQTHVPIDQWDRFLAFRHAMFDDWSSQILIAPPKSVAKSSR